MDTACYGALCKIAQPYLMRYPLVDGDGNFGTQEGNGMEAAQRYTNARPSIYADLMMTDFKKNIVPLKQTYNGEYMEPVVLPSLLPNAIVNGRETIAIGLSHNSLPHNLTEVCNAIIASLKKGESLTIDELMEHIKGPDFPLENVVLNSKDIREAFKTGHSTTSLKVRGVYRIEKNKIIFDTIPYRTYRNKIKEQIHKNIDILEAYIEDFSDESNVGVNKLVFTVKKGLDPEQVVLKLFALTDLQTTLSYNMNFIVDGTPKMCSMMELIDAYINHQMKILIKTTEYDKNKAEKRKHILEGLIEILNNIDKAIELIKKAENPAVASANLMKEFNIDEEQTKAVLDMKLARLTKLDRQNIIDEIKEKELAIAEYTKILTSKEHRNEVLIEKISDLRDKYGDKRRTLLMDIEIPKEKKEKVEIIPEDMIVILTHSGLIKKVPIASYKVQRRAGKGIKSKNDVSMGTFKTNTLDYLMLFSDKGKMYRILVNKIPTGTNADKGTSIYDLISLDSGEKIVAATCLHYQSMPKYIIFATKQGQIKKSLLSDYDVRKNSGIIAIKLREGDSVAGVVFQDEEDLILATKKGMGIRIDSASINAIGRNTQGVIGIKLAEGDEVISMLSLHKKTDELAIFTVEGKGKKFDVNELEKKGRGCKGVVLSKTEIAGIALVSDEDNILLSTPSNAIYISAKDVSKLNRTSEGTIMTKGGRVVSICKI